MNTKTNARVRFVFAIAFTLWLVGALTGLVWANRYSQTAGAVKDASTNWPALASVRPSSLTPTLVMFVHPHCPCTAASIDELDRLMSHCQGSVTAHVLFFRPPEMTEAWTKSALWLKASAIPGVSVAMDPAGAEARRFHSLTSGHTVLYGVDGHLLFQGGITIARGHSGDNPGRTAIANLLHGLPAEQLKTPVFGCSLVEEKCAEQIKL